ncbi:MAG: FkbM family methyltransferase [Reyranella sp.]|uniref:FkbM family methyltransferase n=1 Tax=Reyranella sp. TaxID=1929291 RepID=UPI001ACC77E5|nr:FkbM family methyltransferase [Reyranella sp.]MBN9541271.1 FkbM family methyltransferase [Alphaproteobacteria bacterium]MBR2817170.1 FkbM family methyltransferase [Reyranella sp.]
MTSTDAKDSKGTPFGAAMKARFKDVLRPFVSSLPALSGLPSWSRSMRVLQHHGFQPQTVFDIGVAYGTFPLYRAFPNAFYHLVDPARESYAYMQRLAKQLRCELHAVALADRDGEAALEVRGDIQESTLLEEVGPRRIRRIDRVPLRRFDTLFGPIEGPALCKIDVQGAELMVLAGMTGRLPEIDALVIETSTIATVKGGAEVRDVVSFLGDHGFVLADIVGLRRRPLDDATTQLDLLFVPQDKGLRTDRRWAAAA